MVRSRSWLSALADVLRDEFCQASLSALAKPPPMPSSPPTEPKMPATPRPPPMPPVEALEPPRVDSLSVADDDLADVAVAVEAGDDAVDATCATPRGW